MESKSSEVLKKKVTQNQWLMDRIKSFDGPRSFSLYLVLMKMCSANKAGLIIFFLYSPSKQIANDRKN